MSWPPVPASLGSAVAQGMWNDPSQCVRVWPEDLGCPAVLREPGVRLCVCVHDGCPGYVECVTLVVPVNSCFVP